jgi:hypothetical protein
MRPSSSFPSTIVAAQTTSPFRVSPKSTTDTAGFAPFAQCREFQVSTGIADIMEAQGVFHQQHSLIKHITKLSLRGLPRPLTFRAATAVNFCNNNRLPNLRKTS